MEASFCPNCLCTITTIDRSKVFVQEINRYWKDARDLDYVDYDDFDGNVIWQPDCDCRCHEAANIIADERFI